SASKHLPRKMRATTAEIKFAGEKHLLRKSHFPAQSAHCINPTSTALDTSRWQDSSTKLKVRLHTPDSSATYDVQRGGFLWIFQETVANLLIKDEGFEARVDRRE